MNKEKVTYNREVEKAKKKRKRTGKGDIDGKENVFR
jgi:hypothetical protein